MTNADDALAAAEEAEAEAVEAEAMATAARARARAIRLRREADATAAETKVTVSRSAETQPVATDATETADALVDDPKPVELDKPSDVTEIESPPENVEADNDQVETASVDTKAPETDTEPADASKRRRSLRIGSRAWKVVAGTVAVISTLGLLALSATMIVDHHQRQVQLQRKAEFEAAARQGVVTLMSLDFNNAKENVQRILDSTTGDFRKDFEGQSDDFIQVAEQSKVVTEATVNAVAAQRMDRDTATVLVAVVTKVSNTASNTQEPRSWRLAVDVARDGDQIKLAKVEFVP